MNENIRCPTKACTGWVCEVEESANLTFWGCGECGEVWPQRDALNRSIDQILAKYSYRREVYFKVSSNWQAISLDLEPENYEELVAEEWQNQ